eukprot:s1043_g29.t1
MWRLRRREQEERMHKMAALKKQVEEERKAFKRKVQELKVQYKEREQYELKERVKMESDKKEEMDGKGSKTRSLKADEEEHFNSTLVMRRILKLAFLNAIQRRHIRQHQKNIEVFEQAFATIKSTTGISDIEEIVKIFVALEQRNFSLLTYVNALNREIEALDKQNRGLKDQTWDILGMCNVEQLANQQEIEADSEKKRIAALTDLKSQIESTAAGTEDNKLQASQQSEIIDRCRPVIHSILKTVERENRGFGGHPAPENYKYTVGNQVLALQPKKPNTQPVSLVKAGDVGCAGKGQLGIALQSRPAQPSELPSAANFFLEQGPNQRAALAGREEDSSDDEEELMAHPWPRQDLRDKANASVAKRRRHRRTEGTTAQGWGGLSCVARAKREDAATVAAKHRELAELQKLQEAEQEREDRLKEAQEAARRHAQQVQEQHRLNKAKQWAEDRLAQLTAELRSIQGLASNSRRQRLRALQLELHPDKQPEDRRSAVQPLFLLVQREWESQCEESQVKSGGPHGCHGSDGHWATHQASPWEWARRQASAFSQAQQGTGTRNSRETGGRSSASKQVPKAKATTKPTRPTQTQTPGSFTFSTEDLSTDSETEAAGTELQMGKHWTPGSEDDEDSGIVPLLASGSFEDAMHAFTSIQLARRTRGLDAEKVGHPWKQKMDRFEAEAWRLYAKQQGQNGFHQFAIAEHLQKAISLHPDRGELYFDRAMYRVRLSCPEADVTDLSILSRLQDKDFQKVLEDCEAAISRDSTLLDAFDLSLRLHCVKGLDAFELSKVYDLALQGRRSAQAMGDDERASDFASWRRCAKVLQRGLQRAQSALSAKQHSNVSRILDAVKAAALPEVQQVLSVHMAKLLRQAETQRQFQEAYATAGEDSWAAAWGQQSGPGAEQMLDEELDDDIGPTDEEINEIFLKRYKMSKEELQGMADKMGIQLNNLCYLKQEFDAYDEDRSGYIDVKEGMCPVAGLLEKLGEELSEEELDQAFKELDSDGSGEIEFFEFVEWFTSED